MKTSICISIIILAISCQSDKDRVLHEIVNMDMVESRLKMEELDKTHPQLLTMREGESYVEEAIAKWQDFHISFSDHLEDKGSLNRDSLNIFHRIYFNKNGEIESFFYRILDEFGEEEYMEYEKAISDFALSHVFETGIKVPFVQCGKGTLHIN